MYLEGWGFSFFLTERFELRLNMQEVIDIPELWGKASHNVKSINTLDKEEIKQVIRKAEELDNIDPDFRDKLKGCDKKLSAVVYRNDEIKGLAVMYPLASNILEISFFTMFEKEAADMRDLIYHVTEQILERYGEQVQIRALCRDEISANMISKLFPHIQPILVHRGICITLDEEENAPLHYSRGTYLADKEGKNVLEFDLAGSGFKFMRADYKDINAKTGLKHTIRAWWNSFKSLFTGKKTKEQLNMERVEKILGEGNQVVDAKGTKMEHVRSRTKTKEIMNEKGEKEVIRKQRIHMAGSMGLYGLSNSGDHSIENTRQYVQYMGGKYLKDVFDEAKKSGQKPKDVHVVMKGHSRGAVSAVEGAMMLKQWVFENYPEYEDKVKFEERIKDENTGN